MDPKSILLSSQSGTCSHVAEPCVEDERSPASQELERDSPFPWGQASSSSLIDANWFGDEHIQAKRARVETIVQGICLSPNSLVPGKGLSQARDSPCCPEKRKRKQSLPMQQGPLKPGPAWGNRKGGPWVREQLHLLKQQLRHLQQHILQAAEPRAAAQGPRGSEQGQDPLRAKQRSSCESTPWATHGDRHQDSSEDLHGAEKHRVSEAEHGSGELRVLSSGTQPLLEILRKELTRAMSQAVDSVLQKVLLNPPGHLTQQGRSFQRPVPEGRREPSPPVGGTYKDVPALATLPRRAQPQVGVPMGNLPLAKPLDSPRYPLSPRFSKPYQGPLTNCPLAIPSHVQENQILSQLLGHGPNGHWSDNPPLDSSSQSHPSLESALQPWVWSQQPYPLPFTTVPRLESRPRLPSVKMEQDTLEPVTDAIPFSSIHISFTGH